MPPDPTDCEVFCQAIIGPQGEAGEEIFGFIVITPKQIAKSRMPHWGRGFLVVSEFSWSIVNDALRALLEKVTAESWHEVGTALNRELLWEFDDYRPAA